MQYFAQMLTAQGIKAFALSPEDLTFDAATKELSYQGVKIDLIYNRMTDFRFEDPFHKDIRAAAIAKTIALTPHPAGTSSPFTFSVLSLYLYSNFSLCSRC